MACARLIQEKKHWHIQFDGQARSIRTRFRRHRAVAEVLEAISRDFPRDLILAPGEDPDEGQGATEIESAPLFASDAGR